MLHTIRSSRRKLIQALLVPAAIVILIVGLLMTGRLTAQISTAAAFTPGNVVVYRTGTGTGNLVNTGNPVFLDEYTPTGTLVQSIAMPTTASGAQKPLIASGTATSEGLLTRSADGQFLILTGYGTIAGGSSLAGTTSAAVPRVVGRVGVDGTIDTSTALSDFGNMNNIRGAVSADGTTFWAAGPTGVNFVSSLGATTSAPLASSINVREIAIFNAQLYASSGSGTNTFRGVDAIGTGLPTSGTQTVTRLPGLTDTLNPSTYSFFLADLSGAVAGVDTLYVTDDTNGLGGGITKFSLVGGNWVSNGSLGSVADAYRGLTASVSGTAVTLFATRKGGSGTTGGGELVKLIDSGGYNVALSGTPTLLATATTNTAFRGVALAPVSAVPTVGLSVNSNSASEATPAGITVTAQASAPVSGNQTVHLAVSGTNITSTDYSLTGDGGTGTITILGGQTTGSVTFTVLDDQDVEGTETATLTISSPTGGIALGSPISQNITITDNDSPIVPTVSLAVGTNSASETAVPQQITVTALASSPVSGNQTVSLGVGGSGITATDYSLTSTTITILSGAQSGSVTFTVLDDQDVEPTETATLTISSPTAGIALGSPTSQNITITDNDAAAVCSAPHIAINAVQGSGSASTLVGQTVTVRGVVVGDYEGAGAALHGFYLQDLAADDDNNPATSEGVFVFEPNNADSVSLGQVVQVTGPVSEFSNLTEITASTIENCGPTAAPAPVDVTLPVPADVSGLPYLERFEGMLVRFHQTLFVTEHFELGRFGQVVMSAGRRLPQPTSVSAPGAAAVAQQTANDLNRIIVDDELNSQNPDPIKFGRSGGQLAAANTLRGADSATDMVGVLTYGWAGNAASGDAYRLRPINALGGGVPNFQPSNPRPATPPTVGGRLKVVGMNVLNYFLTLDTGGSPCGPAGSKQACRGANNATELTRQQQKLNSALVKLNADVFGFSELENTQSLMTGQDVNPVADIVARLNASIGGAPVYGYINTGIVGTDTIRVGIAYKIASVTPVGSFLVDTNPIHNRPPIAQLFRENATGEKFSVVANHFKSKGSCPASGLDTDQGDGQGCWNAVRTQQASALVFFVTNTVIPTTGDADVLLVGDFNSYAKEDPIRTLESAGFTNLVARYLGPNAYSYVFDGQWGYLDHGLASTSLVSQITNTGDYHINADEPAELDYNTEFKSAGQIASMFAPDEFRIADHDPVIVGLALAPTPLAVLDHYSVQAGTTLTVNAAQGVLFNDSGGPLAVSTTTTTAHGTLTVHADGSFTYTPNPGFTGTDTFSYSATNASRRYTVLVYGLTPLPPLGTFGGVNVLPGGFGSALVAVPNEPGAFYGLTDRGPNVDGPGGTKVEPFPTFNPFIVKIVFSGNAGFPVAVIPLLAADGTPYSGRVNSAALTGETITDLNGNVLPPDVNGYDPEGLVALPDGTFWVSDEYGPFITHFDANGKQIGSRLSPFDATLPAELRFRVVNRGMEGLTITPDGSTLVGIMQSALQQPDLPSNVNAKKLTAVRIVTYHLVTHAVHEYLYLLDNPATTDTAVSEITALSNTTFVVDERDSAYPPGAYKKLYLIDIGGATDVGPGSSLPGYNGVAGGLLIGGRTIEHLLHTGGTEMNTATSAATLAANGITPVTKALYVDVGAALDAADPQGRVFSHDKLEGVALLDAGGTFLIANDSDFGIDGVIGSAPFAGLHAKVSPVTGQQDDGEFLVIDLIRSTATVTIDVQDTAAPDTVVDSGPSSPTNSTNAGFTFRGIDPGGSGIKSFECQLDSFGFVPCTSGVSYSVDDGPHTFAVRAIDNANNVDPTPATYPWLVDTVPPDTFIDGTPTINGGSATFTFHGTDPVGGCLTQTCAAASETPVGAAAVVGFQCQLDSSAFVTCSSPKTYSGLASGPHTFNVRAIDTAGNVDPTPATFAFTVTIVGTPTAAQSGVVAAPASVPADNSTTSMITVTLRDASSNPVGGKTVTLSAGSGSSSITPASGVTNASGQAVFTVKDAVAQAVTYTATDTTDGVTVLQTATVTFTGTGPSATFVKSDTSTQGSWKGVYGSQGAAIVNDGLNYPSDAQVTVSTGVTWTWAGTTTDGRALQRAASGRIAACWCNTTFDIDVNLTDSANHQVALYGIDWDNIGRIERVDVLAFGTTTVLDTRTLTGFSGGQYLVWLLKGHVTIRVTLTSGPNAVLSGLFFDPGGSGGPTVVTGAATSVAPTSATLNGTFNPNGLSTSAFFQYGLTTSYTSMTGLAGPVGGTSTVVAAIPVAGLSCNTPYHFRIVGQSTGGTNYGSDSMFMTAPCPGGPSAVFVKSDTSTQGNWKGIYGSDGAAIVNDSLGFPTYAQVTTSTNATWTWASSTTDGRALQRAAAGRIAACWCAGTFNFDVNITDGAAHQVALYALDWDNLGRGERIDILAAGTTTVLDTRTLSGFNGGQYLVWTLSGHVTIRVTVTAGANAVVSGLFFDSDSGTSGPTVVTGTATGTTTTGATLAGTVNAHGVLTTAFFQDGSTAAYGNTSIPTMVSAATPVPVTSPVSGLLCGTTYHFRIVGQNAAATDYGADAQFTTATCPGGPSATFVKTDTTTQGNWKGVYGTQGAAIVNDALNYPAYAQVTTSTNVTWTWASSTTDVRALQRAAAGRIAACWCATTFTFDVNLTDGLEHQLALYALDWDNLGRVERIDILAAGTSNVLDTRALSSFSGGQYLVWNVSGHVTIRVTLIGGPNAVVSGLFFGAASSGSTSATAVSEAAGSEEVTHAP